MKPAPTEPSVYSFYHLRAQLTDKAKVIKATQSSAMSGGRDTSDKSDICKPALNTAIPEWIGRDLESSLTEEQKDTAKNFGLYYVDCSKIEPICGSTKNV